MQCTNAKWRGPLGRLLRLGLGFHFVKHCFVIRHEYLSEGFRLGLVLADFRLELRMMVNERLDQNCRGNFIRSLHRRAPYRELKAAWFQCSSRDGTVQDTR